MSDTTIDKQAFLTKLVKMAAKTSVREDAPQTAPRNLRHSASKSPAPVTFKKSAAPAALPLEVINQAVWELLQEDIARFRSEILAEYERLRKAALHKVWGDSFSGLSKSVSAEERLRRRRQAKQQKRLDGKFTDENKRQAAEALIAPNMGVEESRRERAWKFKADALKRSSESDRAEIKAAIKVFTDPDFTEEERKYAQQEIQRRFPEILDTALRNTRESKAENLVRNAAFDTPKTKRAAKEAAQLAVGLNLTDESAQNTVLLRQAITNVTSANPKYEDTYKRRFDRLFQYAAGYAGIDPRAAEAAAFIAGEYGDDLKAKAQTTKMRHYGVRLEPDEIDRQAAAAAVEQWKRQPADKREDVDSHVAIAIANRLNERAAGFRTDERLKAAVENGTWMPSEAYAIRDGKLIARKVGSKGSYGDTYVPFGGVTDAKDLVDSTIVRTRAFGGPTTEDLRLLMRSKAKRMIVVSGNGTFEMELNDPSKRLNLNYWSASSEMQKIRRETKQNQAGVEHTLATLAASNPGMFKKVGVRQVLDPKTKKPVLMEGQFADGELTDRINDYLDAEREFDPTSSKEQALGNQASGGGQGGGSSDVRRGGQFSEEMKSLERLKNAHTEVNNAGIGQLMVPVETKRDGKTVTLMAPMTYNMDALQGDQRKHAASLVDGWTSENDDVPSGLSKPIEAMDTWEAAAYAKYSKAIEKYDSTVEGLGGRDDLPSRFQKERPSLAYLTKDGEKDFGNSKSKRWFGQTKGFRAGHEEAMGRLDSDDAEKLSKAFEAVDEAEQMARFAYAMNAIKESYGDGPAAAVIANGEFGKGEGKVSNKTVRQYAFTLTESDEAAEMAAKTGVAALDDDIDFALDSVKGDASSEDKAAADLVSGKVIAPTDIERQEWAAFVSGGGGPYDVDGKLAILEGIMEAVGFDPTDQFDKDDAREFSQSLSEEDNLRAISSKMWGNKNTHERYPRMMADIRNWAQLVANEIASNDDFEEVMLDTPAFPYDENGSANQKAIEQLNKILNAS